MSKIICEVCGTSYPEVSTQCPICGCVRPADAPVVFEENGEVQKNTYQYVKGGRFSKANVKKRNANNQAVAHAPADHSGKAPAKKNVKKDSGNTGLVITIIVLLLAILAVAGYIVVKFFLPMPGNSADQITTGQVETLPPTEPDLSCTAISVDPMDVSLSAVGKTFALNVQTTPADTTDEIIFASNDESIATVDADGIVTAVSFGDTMITVTCGDMTEVCTVSIVEPFLLDQGSIILEGVGASALIYTGDVDVSDIVWTTDDDSVAIIVDGVVVAVGSGETTVYGAYNGELASCTVTCDVLTETGPDTTVPDETVDSAEPTQAPSSGSYTAPFSLHNLYGGSNSDVTMTVGTTFVLALKDANYNAVTGVTWTVEDGSCCTVTGGTVKAVSIGTATVVATYDGQTYKCTIRVY